MQIEPEAGAGFQNAGEAQGDRRFQALVTIDDLAEVFAAEARCGGKVGDRNAARRKVMLAQDGSGQGWAAVTAEVVHSPDPYNRTRGRLKIHQLHQFPAGENRTRRRARGGAALWFAAHGHQAARRGFDGGVDGEAGGGDKAQGFRHAIVADNPEFAVQPVIGHRLYQSEGEFAVGRAFADDAPGVLLLVEHDGDQHRAQGGGLGFGRRGFGDLDRRGRWGAQQVGADQNDADQPGGHRHADHHCGHAPAPQAAAQLDDFGGRRQVLGIG